jgi:hypothetical protein
VKRLLVTGCSWTWGQGIELAYPPNYGQDWENRSQNWMKLSEPQLEFIKGNRWSKLLADRMGLEEVNVSTPGNSNGNSLKSLVEWVNGNDLSEVDTIIFQLTHPFRYFALNVEGNTPTTGMELAQCIERQLKSGKVSLNWMHSMHEKLTSNFKLLEERHFSFMIALTKWFDEMKVEYPNLNIHILEWISETKYDMNTNPYYLNPFDGVSVMDWSTNEKLRGQDWMEGNGFKTLFPEGHLSIDGMKIFSDIIYDKIKI